MNKSSITSNEYHQDTIQAIINFNNDFPEIKNQTSGTLILGIARGGLQMAQYFGYYFDNRNIEIISSRLYEDMTIHKDNHTITGLNNINLKRFRNVIIVDDVYDSGTTMETVTKIIQEEAPLIKIFRVCTYTKQDNISNLTYAKKFDLDEWIEFPWDEIEFKEVVNEIST